MELISKCFPIQNYGKTDLAYVGDKSGPIKMFGNTFQTEIKKPISSWSNLCYVLQFSLKFSLAYMLNISIFAYTLFSLNLSI